MRVTNEIRIGDNGDGLPPPPGEAFPPWPPFTKKPRRPQRAGGGMKPGADQWSGGSEKRSDPDIGIAAHADGGRSVPEEVLQRRMAPPWPPFPLERKPLASRAGGGFIDR